MHPDSKPLSNQQRQALSSMMQKAMVEIRSLGWAGNAIQAADLADAFHNLPTEMWREDFSFQFFRDSFVGAYQRKYPLDRVWDYVEMTDEIATMGK